MRDRVDDFLRFVVEPAVPVRTCPYGVVAGRSHARSARSSASTARTDPPSMCVTSEWRYAASAPALRPRRLLSGPGRWTAGGRVVVRRAGRSGGRARTAHATCRPLAETRQGVPRPPRWTCHRHTPTRSVTATPTPATTSPTATTAPAFRVPHPSTPTRPSAAQSSACTEAALRQRISGAVRKRSAHCIDTRQPRPDTGDGTGRPNRTGEPGWRIGPTPSGWPGGQSGRTQSVDPPWRGADHSRASMPSMR